jgi:hypothetical protein
MFSIRKVIDDPLTAVRTLKDLCGNIDVMLSWDTPQKYLSGTKIT